MTPTETAAFKWLVRERGYDAGDITFQFRTSPDFYTADGRGWEVKLLQGRSTTFSTSQLAIFRVEPPTVLFWRRNHDASPCAEASFTDLPMPGDWHGLRMHVRHQPHAALGYAIHTAEEVGPAIAEWLAEWAALKAPYQHPLPAALAAARSAS